MIGLIFLLLAFVLILLLWGGSMLAQGWLYQQPADRMPIRAAAGGLVMASFLTLWCWIDSKNPGKYDTLLEFSALEVTDHESFDCVMKKRNGEETVTTFKKAAGSKGATGDFADAKGHHWKKNTSDSMAVAILIHEKDKSEPTRFNAVLDKDGNFTSTEQSQIRYTDDSGRYMDADSLGRVYRRKTGVLIANIFLNFLHFALWCVVLWVGLRYSFWHAIGIAIMMFTFFMVAVQPVLFNQVRPKDGKTAFGPADAIGLVFNSHRSPDVHDIPVLHDVFL
jgi:hypothetical protein